MMYEVGDIIKLDLGIQTPDVSEDWALHCPFVEVLEGYEPPPDSNTELGVWCRAKMYNITTGRNIDSHYVWLDPANSMLVSRGGVRVDTGEPEADVTERYVAPEHSPTSTHTTVHSDGTTVTTPLAYHVTGSNLPSQAESEALWTQAELQAASDVVPELLREPTDHTRIAWLAHEAEVQANASTAAANLSNYIHGMTTDSPT